MLEVNDRIRIPEAELEMSFARSSGPGGQNVNKVNSKAVLCWQVRDSPTLPFAVKARFLHSFASRITNEGAIIIMSDRGRDQQQNIADCREKLQAMLLEVAEPPKRRRATKPTRASKERRIDTKKRRTVTKQGRKSDW